MEKLIQGNRSAGLESGTEPENRELVETCTAKQGSTGQGKPMKGLESQRRTKEIEDKEEPTKGRESQHRTANVGRKVRIST